MGKNKGGRNRSKSPAKRQQSIQSHNRRTSLESHVMIPIHLSPPASQTTDNQTHQRHESLDRPSRYAEQSNQSTFQRGDPRAIYEQINNMTVTSLITNGTTHLRGYESRIPKNVLYSGGTLATITSKFRRKVYLLLEDPRSSWAAWTVTMWIAFTILFGTACFMASSFGDFKDLSFWLPLQAVIVASYCIEYCLRLYAHGENFHTARRFVLSPTGFLDLVAWLPFVLEVAITGRNDFKAQYFGIVRMFRMFRLFRVYKDVSLLQLSIELLITAVRKSADAMIAIVLFFFACTIVLGTLAYFGERNTIQASKTEQIDNIPTAIWFVMFTMTSTGYGDVMVISPWGRLVIFFAIGAGILLMALPSVVIGRNYIALMMTLRKHRPRGALEYVYEDNESIISNLSIFPDQEKELAKAEAVANLRQMAHELSAELDRVRSVLNQLPSNFGANSQFSRHPDPETESAMVERRPFDRHAMKRAIETYDDEMEEDYF